MKKSFTYFYALLAILSILILGCSTQKEDKACCAAHSEFEYVAESFSDLKILRYTVPGFEQLDLGKKELLYYLGQAALAGRDIIWDQNYRYNLTVRHTLEAIINNYNGDKESDDWNHFMVYTKRIWFSSGIHHHYSKDKIMPEFSNDYFNSLLEAIDQDLLPKDKAELKALFSGTIFKDGVDMKSVDQRAGIDNILASCNNYYGPNITQADAEAYYKNLKGDKPSFRPISYGLNSQVVKDENGKVFEKKWHVGGMYSAAIEKIVFWLEKAINVTENTQQKVTLEKLVEYYKTGDLRTFDVYSMEWVKDTASRIDVVNGFIEVYGDALGYKGAYESVVSFKDMEASKRIAAIADQAQWFEDNSPIMDMHKKKEVKGISAKVITVFMEGGDACPSTPIGINLPNANWIRKEHGSKSVNLGNIVHAYEEASKGGGFLDEFCYDKAEIDRAKNFAGPADLLHTDMHEVIGHASGAIEEGVGTPKETLKQYSSTIEEGRADLVALYYLMDQKLVDMGLMPSLESGKAAYDDYIRNGMMTQLVRLKLGEHIEEAHMRNRAWISHWVFEQGKDQNIIEKLSKEGKTYFVVRDYDKLRNLFGALLKEVQRIKSKGDYQAAKELVENYGVVPDQAIHAEVLERYKQLGIAPYSGFIQPRTEVLKDQDKLIDVKLYWDETFEEQMLRYGRDFSYLPINN